MKKSYAKWHYKWLAGCLIAILIPAVLVSLYLKSNNQSIILIIVDKINALSQPTTTNSGTFDSSPEKIDLSNLLVGPATGPLYVDPNNRRYFTDGSGKVVFLTGSHFWDNLQDSGTASDLPYAFDYSGWLDFLVDQNHNFFRLWTWEESKWVVESPAPYYWTPMPYQRTGPGTAMDGKLKFDLTKFDQSYFDRMRSRIIEAGNRGIYVSIMLFNGWSIEYPKGSYASSSPWNGHPFNANNNINGINGDSNGDQSGSEIHTLINPEVTAIQDAYVLKVIDTVNDLDNVLYEISNESPGDSQDWQYHMIKLIKDYETTLPKQHPVGMTVEWPGGDNADLFSSSADWISPNGDINNPPVANGSKIIIADTDHLCGICGDRYWVWKSFTMGENPLFMDQYDDSYKLEGGGYDMNNPNDVSLRQNLGYVRAYAQRMDLVRMTPRPNLCSTGYCLANPTTTDAEYLIYAPNGGQITVNLSSTPGEISLEWFNPKNGNKYPGGTQIGGKIISVQAPFDGDAVLYLYNYAPVEYPHKTALPLILKNVIHSKFYVKNYNFTK